MADFTETATWTPVEKLTVADPVDATTEDSPANKQAKALVKRTAYLKAQVEAIVLSVIGGTGTFGATFNADMSRSLTITHNLGVTTYGVELAPTTNPGGGWGEWWIHSRATNTVELRTTGSYVGNIRWTVRRTTAEV